MVKCIFNESKSSIRRKRYELALGDQLRRTWGPAPFSGPENSPAIPVRMLKMAIEAMV